MLPVTRSIYKGAEELKQDEAIIEETKVSIDKSPFTETG